MIQKVDFKYTNDITVVNREQFEVHLRLYEGYINNINKIDSILRKSSDQRDQSLRELANSTFSIYRELKRGETYALDAVILHELYFENIGGSQEPDKKLLDILKRDFGSYRSWQEDFVATAKVSRGWALLAYDQRSERYRNISLDAHDHGNITYSAPILVLDVYEHAYFLQYADNKGDYINKFMSNINWALVGRRVYYE